MSSYYQKINTLYKRDMTKPKKPLLFLLIIVLIGYIMFKASIWLGVGYIMILIAIIIYLLYKQIEKY